MLMILSMDLRSMGSKGILILIESMTNITL